MLTQGGVLKVSCTLRRFPGLKCRSTISKHVLDARPLSVTTYLYLWEQFSFWPTACCAFFTLVTL